MSIILKLTVLIQDVKIHDVVTCCEIKNIMSQE